MAGGGLPISVTTVEGGFLTGRKLVFPLFLVISLFFLWGFSYGLLDVLNSHFQTVLGITKLQSTGLQVMYFGGGYFFFSPVAAEVLKRKGYKITILMGLSFYSVGAVMFWPTAHFSTYDNRLAAFGGFLVCTLVIACGLATLETAANSYAVVIGDPASASSRLQFCQAWNGVASFIGPLIASKFFFTGANASNLTNVQYVYLAVSCAGIAVAILFAVSKLPEVAESDLQNDTENFEDGQVGQGPIYKQYNMIFGFLAQFCYVGSQVTIGAFFINYALEAGYDKPTSSNMLSYALIVFTVGRFFAFALSWIFQADFLLIVYAIFAIVFNGVVCADAKKTGVPVLMLLYFFEAPMYPTIFTLGTANLGRHTRRGAGILVMGVAGGAVFPPIQGAIADAANTRISMVVPLAGFVYVLGYVTYHWLTHGRHIMRVKHVVVPGSQGTVDATVDGTVDPDYIDVEKAKEAGFHVEEL